MIIDIDLLTQHFNAPDKDISEIRLLAAIQKDPKCFKCIPRNERTEDICYEAAILDDQNLDYMELTDSLVERLIPVHSVPKATLTKLYNQSNEELCIKIMQEHPAALKYIRKQTEAICLAAVSLSSQEFYYVHEQTEKLCEVAVMHLPSLLEHVNKQTNELCVLAISKNVHALKYVRNQTEELCNFAVNINPTTLLLVHNQTYNIILTAVKSFLNNNQSLTKYMLEGYIDWSILTKDETEYIKLLL